MIRTMIKNIMLNYTDLMPPFNLIIITYFIGLFGVFMFKTYISCAIFLQKYREGKLNEILMNYCTIENIKNDWDAVARGADHYWSSRMWDSILWPITLITLLVPSIVLMLNPPQKKIDKND